MLSEEAISSLLNRLKEPNEYENTVQELVALGSSAVPSLIRALTDDSEVLNVRLGVAAALRDIPDERIIEPLISVCNLTNQEDEPLDYLIVPAFAQFGARALPPLVAALRDRQRDVLIRAAAAWALGTLGEPEVLEVLVERVKDGTEASRVRSHAAYGLGDLGDRRAVAPLMEVLNQEADEDVRRSAVVALGQLADRRAVELLINILETDRQSDVRQRAAKSLGLIGDERAIRPLVEAVARDALQLEAAEALGQFGAPALHALLEVLQKSHHKPSARRDLVRALGHFKQEEAFTKLLAVLTDETENRFVRTGAAWALGLQRDPRASQPLLALLESHEDTLLRIFCVMALGLLRDRQALPVLQEVLRNESAATPEENELKRVVERAIRMIKS